MIAFGSDFIILHRRFLNHVPDFLAIAGFRQIGEGIEPEPFFVRLHNRGGKDTVFSLFAQEHSDGFRPLHALIPNPALDTADVNFLLVGRIRQPVMHPQQRMMGIMRCAALIGPDGILLIDVVFGLTIEHIVERNKVILISVGKNGRIIGGAADSGFPQRVDSHMAIHIQGKILPRIRPSIFAQHTLDAFIRIGVQRTAIAPQLHLHRDPLGRGRGRIPIRFHRHGKQLLGNIADGDQRAVAEADVGIRQGLPVRIGQCFDSAILPDRKGESQIAGVAFRNRFGQRIGARFQMQIHMAAGIRHHLVIRNQLRKVIVVAILTGAGLAGQHHFGVFPAQGKPHALHRRMREGVDLEQRENMLLRIDILERHRLIRRCRQIICIGFRHDPHQTSGCIVLPAGGRSGRAGNPIAGDGVPFIVQAVILLRKGIFPQWMAIQNPRIGVGFRVVLGIAGLPLPGFLPRRLQAQREVRHNFIVLCRIMGHKDGIAAVFNGCNGLRITSEGLGHAQLGFLGHQRAVNVPAIGLVVFDHIPADGKVIRRDAFRWDHDFIHFDGIANLSDMRQHVLIRRKMANRHAFIGRSLHGADGAVRFQRSGRRVRRRQKHIIFGLPQCSGEPVRSRDRGGINSTGEIFLRLLSKAAGGVIGNIAGQIDIEIGRVDPVVLVRGFPLGIKLHHAVALVTKNLILRQFLAGVEHLLGVPHAPARKLIIIFFVFGRAGNRYQHIFLIRFPQQMPVAGHPYILPAAAAQNRALRIHRLLAIGDLPQRLQAFGHRGGIILDGIGHFLGSVGDFDGPAEIGKAEKDAAVLFPLFIRGQLYLQTIVNGMPIYAAGNRKRHVHFAAGALIPFPAFPGRNAGWIGNGDAVKGIILNQRCIAPLIG